MRISGVLKNPAQHISLTCMHTSLRVVVRYLPRVKFYFPLFKNHYYQYTFASPETEKLNLSRKRISAGGGGKVMSSKGTLQTDFVLAILWERKVRLVHHNMS